MLQPSRMRGPGGWEGESVSSNGNPPPLLIVKEFLAHILQQGQETAFLSYGRDECVAWRQSTCPACVRPGLILSTEERKPKHFLSDL